MQLGHAVVTPPKTRQVDDLVLLPTPDAQHALFRLVHVLKVSDYVVAGVAASELYLAQVAAKCHAGVVDGGDQLGDERRVRFVQLGANAVKAVEGDAPGVGHVLDGDEAVQGKLDFWQDYLVGADLDVRSCAADLDKWFQFSRLVVDCSLKK